MKTQIDSNESSSGFTSHTRAHLRTATFSKRTRLQDLISSLKTARRCGKRALAAPESSAGWLNLISTVCCVVISVISFTDHPGQRAGLSLTSRCHPALEDEERVGQLRFCTNNVSGNRHREAKTVNICQFTEARNKMYTLLINNYFIKLSFTFFSLTETQFH